MAFTPVAGPVAVFQIGGVTAAPAINWKLGIDGKHVDVSNFRDGRQPAITLTDVDLTFTLIWDAAAPPTDTTLLNIRMGTIIAGQCFTSGAGKFFGLNAMITMTEPSVDSLEDVLRMPVTAKISGTLTYPTNT